MKKMLRNLFLTTCFTFSFALGIKAQLPSEKALPIVLDPEVKQRMQQKQTNATTVTLPSESKKTPKHATLKAERLPNSNARIHSLADKRKALPSSAQNPVTTLKRKRGSAK